jgi:hypothetical protein
MIPKCELQEHVQLCHPFILDFSFIYERSLGFYGHLQMLERVTNSNFANICTTHIFTPLHDFQLKIVETEYSHLVFLLLLYPEGFERTKWILGFIVHKFVCDVVITMDGSSSHYSNFMPVSQLWSFCNCRGPKPVFVLQKLGSVELCSQATSVCHAVCCTMRTCRSFFSREFLGNFFVSTLD